jgi:RNA polymerase sigma-70 factor, ECF subfamily
MRNNMSQSEIDRLYRAYGFMIFGRCLRLLGSRDEARDAMQAVFMKLVQAYETIADKEKVVPWIFRTAQNYCFNVLRDRKKFVGAVDADTIGDPQDTNEAVMNSDLISKVMREFRRDVCVAVYYTYMEKLDQREIQRITGQSPATIRRNLRRFKDGVPGILKRLEEHDLQRV